MEERLRSWLQQYHTGESRGVCSKELEMAFGIRSRELRRLVNNLRIRGYPICSGDAGYFYAETEEELLRTIWQLTSRIRKIAEASKGLNSALPLYREDGQTSLLS